MLISQCCQETSLSQGILKHEVPQTKKQLTNGGVSHLLVIFFVSIPIIEQYGLHLVVRVAPQAAVVHIYLVCYRALSGLKFA